MILLPNISNLGGRRAYKEKRAAKVGFATLHSYLEAKFEKKAQALAEKENKLFKLKSLRALPKTPKKKTNKNFQRVARF